MNDFFLDVVVMLLVASIILGVFFRIAIFILGLIVTRDVAKISIGIVVAGILWKILSLPIVLARTVTRLLRS